MEKYVNCPREKNQARIACKACRARQEKNPQDCIGCKNADAGIMEKAKAAGTVKEPRKAATPRTDSKIAKVKAAFLESATMSKEELCKISGYDERNLNTSLTILMNETRTKQPFYTVYNPADKTYTHVKDKAAREKIMADRKATAEPAPDAEAKPKAKKSKKAAQE